MFLVPRAQSRKLDFAQKLSPIAIATSNNALSLVRTAYKIGAFSAAPRPTTNAVKIGSITLRNNLVVAPMAGVTDRPFRQLCKKMGAGMAVSEMVASNSLLWGSEKTIRRGNHEGEVEPKVIQIAGSDPAMMAEAAKYNVDKGAQIIDINMGCPAKKICNVAAGSALLKDEPLVARIVEAVVRAVDVPVTLKFRTGWNIENRNALAIARIAEDPASPRSPCTAARAPACTRATRSTTRSGR